MEKLLNDQMSGTDVIDYPDQQINILMTDKEKNRDIESEIEFGNLSDYLEIYGDLDDI
ncbi:MAG TPA: hypothetical protein PLS94_09010 [Prolixibacteraceae bacterium]|nr:hypothetical protein [Prolixibacteraceae bacterium]